LCDAYLNAHLFPPAGIISKTKPGTIALQDIVKCERITTADATGAFEFIDIPDGTYTVVTKIQWFTGRETTGGVVMQQVEVSGGAQKKIILN
jgi:hypothetical protein